MSNIERKDRIAGVIIEQLAGILYREFPQYMLKIAVTRVVMSKDISTAKVWIDIRADNHEQILRKVIAARGRIRHQLSQVLAAYTCPELFFIRDENPDYVSRIDELIARIHAEKERF
ncbi:MAG: 30S ribosome-binding factor RbfA [Patescibacteria group bacterium]|nr:30S ribosome-binding factor RbfA [Patescibacteria group bacterium]